MPSPLQELIAPDSKAFVWVDHDSDLTLGPFSFPAAHPIPVAAESNRLAHLSWLQVPFEGRMKLSAHAVDAPEDQSLDGEEVLRALLEGHITSNSPDAERLVDQVARCLLIHSAFGSDREYHTEAGHIFATAKSGPELYDLLVTRARARIQDGAYQTEQGQGDGAVFEYLLAVLMLHGAHLISPATHGVLYDLGVLQHELAHSLSFEDEKEASFWLEGLSRESSHALQLAMADEDLREDTPAFYLLAINREVVGDLDGARGAYERFLKTVAAKKYQHITEETLQRLSALPGGRK
jgi:hypothetical protein